MVRMVLRCARRASSVYGVLALLVLLGTCSPAVAFDPVLDPVRDFVARTVTRFVTKSFKGTLEVGSLRGSLISAPVVQGITLRDEHGTVVAQIAELRLVYDLTALLRRRLKIQTIEIVQLQATLAPEADGSLNLLALLGPAEPAAPVAPAEPQAPGESALALEVDRLRLRDSALTLQFPALPGLQKLEQIQVAVSAQQDAQGLRLQVHECTMQARPTGLQLRTLQGAVQLLGGRMQVEDVRVQTDQSTLTADGALPGGGQAASLLLHAQSQDLTEFGRLLQNDTLQGQADLVVKAQGPPEAVAITSQLNSAVGQIALQSQLNLAATPLQYSGTLALTHLNLAAIKPQEDWRSDLNLQLRVEGSGTAPQERRGTAHLEIRPSRLRDIVLHPSYIDLAVNAEQLQVQRFEINTSIAQATVKGTFELAGAADMQYAFTADLAAWQSLVGLPALGGHVEMQGQLNGAWPALGGRGTMESRNLRYQDNSIDSLHLTYEGSQLGSQPQLTSQLRVRQARLGTIPVEQVNVDVTYAGAERQVQFATEVVQAAKSGGRARGKLIQEDTGQQVVLEELQIRLPDRTWHAPAPIQVAFGPQRLAIGQFRLVHDDESIELSGAMQGEELQDLRVRVTQFDLSYLQQLLQLPDVIGGHATYQAQLSGTRAAPRFASALTVQPAAAQRLPFTRFHTTLDYAQHQLQSAGRLHQGSREIVALDARLPIDLALTDMPLGQRLLEAPLAVQMRLQDPDLAALRHWQPSLPRLQGTLQGSVDLQGTYNALTLDVRAQPQQLGIEGSVTQMRGPTHLHGTFRLASSMAEMAQAIEQRSLTPEVSNLTLQIPSLQGRWLANGPPGEPWQVENFLLQAKAQLTAKGPQATLENLHLQVTGFGMPRTEVQLAAHWSPARVELSRFELRQPQSEVRAQGHVTLPEQQVQFRLDMPRLHLASLPLALPPTLPPVLQGSLSARGYVHAPEVEARLQYAGAQINADLSAQLQEALPRYRVALRVDNLALGQVLPSAQGSLQARLQLQGRGFTGERAQATLEASLDTTGFNLVPGLTTRLRAALNGTTLQLEQLQVRSSVAEVTASGTLAAASKTALQYRLTLRDLAPLQPLLGVPVQARGDLSGEVQGALNALRARGTLKLDGWRAADFSGQGLQASFTASQIPGNPQASLRAQMLKVQGATLAPSSVSLEGTYGAQQGTFTVAVTEGPYQRSRLVGNVSLATSQRLTLKTLRLQHKELAWENAAPVEIARSPRGVVQLQRLDLRSGAQALRLHGSLDPQGAVQGEVQVQALQLRPLTQAFVPDQSLPDGRLDLSLTLAGTLQQPRAQGQLSLTALQWQKRQLGDIQVTIGLNNMTAQTELHWELQGRSLLEVRSTMRLDATQTLNVQVRAPGVDLDLLGPLNPAVRHSAGRLTLDLNVTGTVRQPQVRGEFLLQDGMLELAAVGERYKDIQVRVVFAGNRVTIEQLRLESRSGHLQVTGWLEHADLALRQVDMAVSARDFSALHTSFADAVVSADVAVRGSLQELSATGSITVPSAHLRLEQVPGGGQKAVQPWELTVPGVYGTGPKALGTAKGQAAGAPGGDDPLPFLQADLRLDMPRNVWVQGPSTAVELSGNLRVTKALRAPFILSGSIETVRGYAGYYGKKFAIETGRVTFTGTPEINPMLDVTVVKKISEYLVSIHVEGRAQQPTLVLSSVPELPQADILSLLVLGKTTERLTKSERNSLGSGAGQVAGDIIAGQLEQTLGKSLGLDTLEIDSGETLGSGSVKAGRYVTQDLFLSLEREVGDEHGTTVGVEYSINRRLKVRGSSSSQGSTAIDFFWRLDY